MAQIARTLKNLLVANRGEIAIRVMRAATELKMRTLAVYTYEDRYSLHRYKADEAYLIGAETEPLKPYLDIEEIVELAKRKNVDAIHPGYGFLSENASFARACRDAGIEFIGPSAEVLEKLGDKIGAKRIARKLGIPVIEDSQAVKTIEEAIEEAKRISYPLIIKAAGGGGGRGMRVVRKERELSALYKEARAESLRAFNNDTVFLEKYIENPKHLEVQIIGDKHGRLLHFHERDCSVQRRFQKVVEIAPCPSIGQETREELFRYALEIGKEVGYFSVGTVEFLLESSGKIYFIEVNPRIQVEHTVTEEVTGIDLVRAQILVSLGHSLDSECIALGSQKDIPCNGYAIQCRITTEDPENDFKPDYGRISAYRSPGGFGIRLDAGSAYAGAKISPFFDSLLVKVTSSGRTLAGAADRLHRALEEFRIRGLRTNIDFLENVLNHSTFRDGKATVNFIDDWPELFRRRKRRDRASKVLNYLADVAVNGNADIKNPDSNRKFREPSVPKYNRFGDFPEGSRHKLLTLGRNNFLSWLSNEKAIQYTDTTFRDAHQSLLATRLRTIDMIRVAESLAKNNPNIFSMEVWGGATFDVALRFLHECPWERLRLFREAMPNILLQMLLRGSNAVGYSAYPDNLIGEFIRQSAKCGVDIFRIFDSMNWLDAMLYSIRVVREETNSIAEVCMCYTGDILNPARRKFDLQYYLDFARRLEDAGAHILAIKDMAGLLKPQAATLLIEELKKVVQIPIHLHTHDTSSVQAATYLMAVEAGVDILDVALSSMSGLTSQPSFEAIASMFRGHPRENPMDISSLNKYSAYFEAVREYYYPFECELKAGTAEIYEHEIPGGQYSNLRPQARALGLEDRFENIKQNYQAVNQLLGDVIKVTPTSKVVGDLALFMTANDLTADGIMQRGSELSFPESLKSYFRGDLGQPYGGFPSRLQEMVLKGEKPYTSRPNEHLAPVDFAEEFKKFIEEFGSDNSFLDFLSYKMYPRVFASYSSFRKIYGDVSKIPTQAFFYGLRTNEEILVTIDEGKTLIIQLVYISEPDEAGIRHVSFKLNGQSRAVEVRDTKVKSTKIAHRKAQGNDEIASPLQGKLSAVLVKVGEELSADSPLFVIEAMKMETIVTTSRAGVIREIFLKAGEMVETGDAILELRGS